MDFNIKAPFEPAGDQPQAIEELVDGVNKGLHTQVLLGATGTGKTYTSGILRYGAFAEDGADY